MVGGVLWIAAFVFGGYFFGNIEVVKENFTIVIFAIIIVSIIDEKNIGFSLGAVDYFVASQGTGGTITGVAKYLKEQQPAVKAFAVEPAECDILSGGKWGPHRIKGIGDGFIPSILNLEYIDGVVTTTSDEAIAMARRLAQEEGIFCGISSGCNVAAAVKVAHRHPDANLVVTMINDNGLRYLSTELCGESKQLEVPDRKHPASERDRDVLASRKLEIIKERTIP
jgi:cysteine synthase A